MLWCLVPQVKYALVSYSADYTYWLQIVSNGTTPLLRELHRKRNVIQILSQLFIQMVMHQSSTKKTHQQYQYNNHSSHRPLSLQRYQQNSYGIVKSLLYSPQCLNQPTSNQSRDGTITTKANFAITTTQSVQYIFKLKSDILEEYVVRVKRQVTG